MARKDKVKRLNLGFTLLNLKLEDVLWSRLTTAYGRASGFSEIFKRLWAAIYEQNLAQSVVTSKSNSGQDTANPANNN